ncbi:MAG: PSD1 and planctomycete cytochrome C domain-containing protein [Planctomycetia bacterium]|nr:PSD1 and planctomycete cytochrome C domain-containing protein [Planctomycetia bacterium]
MVTPANIQRLLLACVCTWIAAAPAWAADATSSPTAAEKRPPVSYNRDIRPILATNCFSCHGSDLKKAEGGVSLVDYAHATAARKGDKPAIVPGKPTESVLIDRIFDADEPMPPVESHKQLTPQQKNLLKNWIEQGAKYQKHWAYELPVLTATPEVSPGIAQKSPPISFQDNYILARLEAEGLSPAPEADRATLCRRLYQDLLGLPPTPAQLDAFLADTKPDAYERLVDTLLASPHFAERMATYWFDLVRYSDTVGLHGDQEHKASLYRDWVLAALVKNMPHDQFIQWQLGGDLVQGLSAEDHNDALVASCYNRLIETSHEGGAQPKEYTAIYQADRVRNTSLALMGASMGCCQCHDHKYDPYTAKDFYSFGAIFADIDDLEHLRKQYRGENNREVTLREPEMDLLSPLERLRKSRLLDQAAQEKDPAKKEALKKEAASFKPRTVMVSKSSKPREVHLLPRGNWMDESGPVVTPQVPAFLGSFAQLGVSTGQRPTRLDFGKWLTTPAAQGGCGELTARVWVNRLWYLFHGQGLCPSVDDLGGQGEPCTHPELLDRLTLEYIKLGWDNRAMIRLLVTSRSYRMSSVPSDEMLAKDPRNLLFARQGRWRLPAEHIRDGALAASGLLVSDIGGPTSRPYQPEGYYQHLQFPDRTYHPDADSKQWKRGVYVHWQRMFLHPALKAFDAPSREDSCPRRSITNTPSAALVTLNDPTFVEAARVLAEMAMKTGGKDTSGKDDDARCRFILRRCLSRVPTSDEVKILLGVLAPSRKEFSQRPADAAALVAIGITPADKTLPPVELASFTQAARVAMNLHETLNRD